MEYFFGHEIPVRKLEPILGHPIKKGVRGTPTYFIKELTTDLDLSLDHLIDGKGLFQLFQRGLLFRIFKNSETYTLTLKFDEISNLTLIKGRETISPIFLSLFWILLRLGVHIDIARYFSGPRREYRIEETVLEIRTSDFCCNLTTSSYTFNAQERFFSNLNSNNKIEIIKTPANTL